ncbi:YcnI family protein [Amycolatopsis sp. NBC_00345]|uniref:DUF1775 domain-containing protein n=1 Tax=Amycolatopsis sp. NBC_00345 TaxID=2975955 RepID=UPI002E2750C8
MAHRPKLVLPLLIAVLTAVLGLPALAIPAAARVSIVPDKAAGGGTQTFAFRLANERSGTTSTRLEVTFPQDPPIAFVEVAPARGWTATVRPRPLNPPVTVGDKTISQVAGSIVLAGGAVQPHQFEQFLITMGPLPADGRLLFQTTQTFANGEVEHLTEAQVTGSAKAGAPVISLGAATAEAPAPPASGVAAPADTESAIAVAGATDQAESGNGGLQSLTVLWAALGVAAVIILATWLQARRRTRSSSTSDRDGPGGPEAEPGTEPAAAHEAGPAEPTEVTSK